MLKNISLDFAKIKLDMKNEFFVNDELEWSLEYLATKEHLEKTKIKIVVPAYQHQRSEEYLQTYDYWKANYIYLDCADDIKADVHIEKIETAFKPLLRWEDSNRVAIIILENGLSVGEKFTLHFGGIDRPWLDGEGIPSHIGQFAPFYPETRLSYEFFVDFDGRGFKEYKVFEDILLKPENAAKIKLYCETKVKKGQLLHIKYMICDRFNNPIFNQKLENEIELINLENNTKKTFEKGITEFKIEEEGYYAIDIKQSALKVYRAIVRCIDGDLNIYWGDTHNHSNLSANIRDNDLGASPDRCYEYGKKVSFLDYMCLSEQTHKINEDRAINIDSKTWYEIQNISRKHCVNNEFVTFWGIELHGKRGDTVVVFKDNAKIKEYPKDEISKIDQFWENYDDIITIPHFHVYSNGRRIRNTKSDYLEYNMSYWSDNSEKERLGEIFSSQWGRFENLKHPMLLKARNNIEKNTFEYHLSRGCKWGVTACSDMHDGRPGYGGLTACIAKELSKEDIFNSLWNKKTYASTGPRFYINTRILDTNILIDALSPNIIEHLEIIGDGKILKSFDVDNNYFNECWNLKKIDKKYYYIRLRMSGGHIGWSEIMYI